MQNQLDKEIIVSYIEKASTVILGIFFLLFPLIFTNLTTDLFIIPKQALLIFSVLALMLLFGVKSMLTEKVRIKRTPFDLPILLLVLSVLISVIFSVARYDSIFNFIPFLFAALSFFVITYNVRDSKSLNFLVYALVGGGAISAFISILSFFKVYLFTFDFSKFQTFTTLGSLLDQSIYLAAVLIFAGYFLYPFIKRNPATLPNMQRGNMVKLFVLVITSVIIAIGLIFSAYMLITLQQPVILPFSAGLQIAFASVSQDATRILQGFLFGSGYGEFSISFMRFKQATFNTYENIWGLTFFRSSSYALQLLATTGIMGILAFIFLCIRIIKQRPLFVPLLAILIAAFLLPFAFYHVVLLFILLGLFSAMKGLHENSKYFEVELQLLSSKRGFLMISQEDPTQNQAKNEKALSVIVLSLIIAFVGIFGFLAFDYLSGNINFQKSLLAASKNDGNQTYNLQSNTLNSFTGRYVDSYYRVFSQTNLALANSLASQIPQGSSPSAQVTQNIYTLVQQSINSARTATTVSPLNSINWQNLSSVYRALIGFGQNADSFAVLASQQATQLDSSNPQEYLNLGGIYYQLGLWDKAIEQFQLSINLKPDYANAYYNYAYSLIQKGDLSSALTQLQTVKSLIANDKPNVDKIDKEIADLEAKIGQQQANIAQPPANPEQQQQLEVNQPPAALPTQNPPIEIQGPSATVTPTPTPAGGVKTDLQPTTNPTP